MDTRETDQTYEELRRLAFSIAYRMVGSVTEAEDIVQEALLRFHRRTNERDDVESPRAFVAAVTTRIAIDHLRSARVRRERYVGAWLPEPLVAQEEPDVAIQAETADSISMAFLVLLETLSPVERAVFLLREVFGYDYDEIARIVDKSPENCRQISSRARRHVESGKPRFDTSREQREELGWRFFEAVRDGDADGVLRLLAPDVVAVGDGGGKAPAMREPLHGRERVGGFLLALARQIPVLGIRIELALVNGLPGAVAYDRDGAVVSVIAVEVAGGQISTVQSVVNPDKLHHLGPVADVRELLRGRWKSSD